MTEPLARQLSVTSAGVGPRRGVDRDVVTATRVAGVLAWGCLVVHVVLLLISGAAMWSMTVPMLVLSAVCAACARKSWDVPTRSGMVMMVGGGASMVLLHLLIGRGHGMSEEMSMGAASGSSGLPDLLMHAGVLIGGTQAVLALTAVAISSIHAGSARRD